MIAKAPKTGSTGWSIWMEVNLLDQLASWLAGQSKVWLLHVEKGRVIAGLLWQRERVGRTEVKIP